MKEENYYIILLTFDFTMGIAVITDYRYQAEVAEVQTWHNPTAKWKKKGETQTRRQKGNETQMFIWLENQMHQVSVALSCIACMNCIELLERHNLHGEKPSFWETMLHIFRKYAVREAIL